MKFQLNPGLDFNGWAGFPEIDFYTLNSRVNFKDTQCLKNEYLLKIL